MKIHIIFSFIDGPYGGGNQFLKALRKEINARGLYTDDPSQASVFLCNSFQDIHQALHLKRKYPQKIFVHRIDGPISVYRNNPDASVDQLIFEINEKLADATIFQSQYSARENKRLGMKEKLVESIIFNAPDKTIFYPPAEKKELNPAEKTRLVSVSWSANPMKGFEFYSYLDQHLDFNRYSYTFVGNSPVTFQNIQILPPQNSQGVAELLRQSDIYITASQKESCSNSLIEAISCGLPCLAIDSGSNPELVDKGGELFNTTAELLEKIKKIENNYVGYCSGLPSFDISQITDQYLQTFEKIVDLCQNKNYQPQKLTAKDYLKIKFKLLKNRI